MLGFNRFPWEEDFSLTLGRNQKEELSFIWLTLCLESCRKSYWLHWGCRIVTKNLAGTRNRYSSILQMTSASLCMSNRSWETQLPSPLRGATGAEATVSSNKMCFVPGWLKICWLFFMVTFSNMHCSSPSSQPWHMHTHIPVSFIINCYT